MLRTAKRHSRCPSLPPRMPGLISPPPVPLPNLAAASISANPHRSYASAMHPLAAHLDGAPLDNKSLARGP